MEYQEINEVINADGLRIVLVQGFPSPWGQAAKAMMEYKSLDYTYDAKGYFWPVKPPTCEDLDVIAHTIAE